MNQKTCPLKHIAVCHNLQMRDGELDDNHIDTLVASIKDGEELPPIILFEDTEAEGEEPIYYIGDGNHRRAAWHEALGFEADVPAIIHPGGREAAFRYALGANADQRAKPRSRADLNKAVTAALGKLYFAENDGFPKFGEKHSVSGFQLLPKGKRATMEEIAELCKTTNQTVSNIKKRIQKEYAPVDEKDPGNAPEAPAQRDFFELINDGWDPVGREIEDYIKTCELFIDDKYPRADKLKALKQIKRTANAPIDEMIKALEAQDGAAS